MEKYAFNTIVIFGVFLLIVIVVETNTAPPVKCLKWQQQTVASYPYAGLTAMGPEYTAMAMVPDAHDELVCIQTE